MAIISPQRDAIESLRVQYEALVLDGDDLDVPDSLGQVKPLTLLGVSTGANSTRPYVLVCGEINRDESSQHIDVGACDFAVLLREASGSERGEAVGTNHALGNTALQTVELLREIHLPGRINLIPTGIVETYPII